VQGGVRIGAVFGVDIRVHRSWIVIALLVAWSFVSRYAVDRSLAVAIAMGLTAAVLFFASVLVHELAHALEAEHRGVEVGGITLFLFGGATETRFDVRRPVDEFALTAVGPFSSFVLAGLFGIVATYGGATGLAAVAQVAGTLAWINLALAVFNLLPGAPLDGGRILRSLVWKVTGDRGRAVRVASRAGQALGYTIAALGVLQLFTVRGQLIGGLWWVLIGWFLANAAGSELVQHELESKLADARLGDLVSDDPLPSLPEDVDVAAVAEELRRRPESVLSLDRGAERVALVGVEEVASVPAAQRPHRRAVEIARPLAEVPTMPADRGLVDALRAVGSDELLAVTRDGGEVIGVVTREQLHRIAERSLRMDGPTRASRHSPASHLPGQGDHPRRRRGWRRRPRHRDGHVPEGGQP
jgi:Zn-dependent protease